MYSATVDELRAIESDCVRRITQRADRLQREQGLPRSIALGKAIEALPATSKRYLDARARLGLMGVGPLPMK